MSEPTVEPHAHSGGGFNPLGALTKKIGPLPGWVWAALVVGGYVAYRYIRGRNAPATIGADAGTESAAPSDTGAGVSSADGGLGAGDVVTGFQQQVGNAIPVGPRSNGEWARMAVAYLISHGKPPLAASNAIANYVGRKPLTPEQRDMVALAIRGVGSPPEGVIGSTTISSKPNPSHHNIAYTTKRGDTLYSLATRYYGDKGLWLHIRSHNDNLHKYAPGENIKPGLHITIPFFVTQPKAG